MCVFASLQLPTATACSGHFQLLAYDSLLRLVDLCTMRSIASTRLSDKDQAREIITVDGEFFVACTSGALYRVTLQSQPKFTLSAQPFYAHLSMRQWPHLHRSLTSIHATSHTLACADITGSVFSFFVVILSFFLASVKSRSGRCLHRNRSPH